MTYTIAEVRGDEYTGPIRSWNRAEPSFPALQDRHLVNGFWWFVDHLVFGTIGFAGMVPFEPFPRVGYLKRAYIAPDNRGHGLQRRLIEVRIEKARMLGWTQLVSDCHHDNVHAARNFAAAGFEQCRPEQPWFPDSLFWSKML